jgi:hypothetical protein
MRLLTALSRLATPVAAVVLQQQRSRGRAKLHTRKSSVRSVSSMQIVHKTAYWGEIEVGGTKGGDKQAFNVIFDTGSGNLILPGSKCTTPGKPLPF